MNPKKVLKYLDQEYDLLKYTGKTVAELTKEIKQQEQTQEVCTECGVNDIEDFDKCSDCLLDDFM